MPPRTRISEAPKRISSTRDVHQQRRNSSDSDPLTHRSITDRSPRLYSNRQSPKGSHSDPLHQRKLGTRITDLESQLVQAQKELKNLKQQLTSKRKPSQCHQDETPEETHKETDVFEVPMEKPSVELAPDPETDKPDEMAQLKSKLEEACDENEALKKRVNEVSSEMTATKLKNSELEKELSASNETKTELMEKVRAVEFAKEELEVEMKRLRVQTEQWRKAADAAAAVLAGGEVEVSGGRASERRGSMERHYNSVFEAPPMIGSYPGYLGSPGADDDGKRKGSGIRMFGDLWKKKGQK